MLCDDQSIFTDDNDPHCSISYQGNDNHPGGGVQIMGDVLITSDERDNAFALDIRNVENPVRLPCKFPNKGGVGGIVWYPDANAHVVSIGHNLFISNGKPLDDAACEFTQPLSISIHPPGEGFGQLFYDRANKRLVSIGGFKTDAGEQKVSYQQFELKKSPAVQNGCTTENGWMFCEGPKPRKDIILNSPRTDTQMPSLRWGGTARMYENGFDIVLAPNLLAAALTDPDMTIDVYDPCPECSAAGGALTLRIISVKCVETTELGEDEIYLTVGAGNRIPAGDDEYHDIDNGLTWTVESQFSSDVALQITLMEYDTLNDRDLIGAFSVPVSTVKGVYDQPLSGDDGQYVVTYEVK